MEFIYVCKRGKEYILQYTALRSVHFMISGFTHNPEQQDYFSLCREFTNTEANSFHHKPNSIQVTE